MLSLSEKENEFVFFFFFAIYGGTQSLNKDTRIIRH